MTTTLVALYDEISTAHEVVQHLVRNGFARDDISVIARDVDSQYSSYVDTRVDDDGNEVAEGAGIGAIIGGIGGLLVGLGALAIPGIGPVIAAGPIVAGLTGAGLGAVAGGVVGALVDMGLPEAEAERYAEGLRRGGALVTAQVADERVDEAMDIMDRHHPIDLKERTHTWQESGCQGFSSEADMLTSADIERERSLYSSPRSTMGRDMTYDETRAHSRGRTIDNDEHIDIVEEDVKIGKRAVDRGGVRVHSYVVERPVEEDVVLEETRVNVERRNVDRPASQADLDAFQERTIEVNETAEELVINKEARVTGEVHINKEREQHTERVRETARRTEVDVEHVGDVGDYTRYEPQFRSHYESTYGTSGLAFDEYSPAYRYGYQLANDTRYTNRPWSEIESAAQRDWNDRYQRDGSTWDQVKDAVRHGWERVRNG
jgi:uncharacterized protein (TIGR02271 family)